MIIDCDRCEMRDLACGDCVVTFLLGPPAGGAGLDEDERLALGVLADSGLVPPLRLVVDDPADPARGGRAPGRRSA